MSNLTPLPTEELLALNNAIAADPYASAKAALVAQDRKSVV